MDDATPPDSNPFAAPPLFPAAVAGAPEMAVVGEPTPARKHTGRWVAIAVVVLLLAAGGVVLATRGSDTGYSLTAAAKVAGAATNVAFETTTDAGTGPITMKGRMDTAAKLMAGTAKVTALGDQEITYYFDLSKLVMYMDASSFGTGADAPPTKWVSLDLTIVPGLKDAFGSFAGGNPLEAARLFTDAHDVKVVGIESVKGESMKHYAVTVLTADLKVKAPDLFKQLDAKGVKMPDQIVYDVWVSKASQLRRVKNEMQISGQTVSSDTTYTAIGAIDPIVLPDAKDVTDVSQQLAGSASGG
jgi:hypothetical protein